MKTARLVVCACLALYNISSLPRANGQVQFLQQNWNDAMRQLFYTTSQGSRLIPYEWFLALEVSDGESSFLKTRVPQFGYLPNDNTLNNPDRLPVGFVADVDGLGRTYLGMNCAACHTNRIQYDGKTYQVDGAPTQADMWGLLTGIRDSLNATAADELKFSRFATKVLGTTSGSNDVARLRNSLNDFRAYWNQFITDSTPDPTGRLTWGRARLDAFGMIFNRVSSIDLQLPVNSHPPNAPVSYPFLWGASAEDFVQWNASAPNRNDFERLGRNVGEVLGVFGVADLQKASPLRPYYRTSAKRLNQVRMENWLKLLWSPKWPDDFPPIDITKRDAGKQLYDRHCLSCHQVIPHGHQANPVTVGQIPVNDVGTDNRMALNAIERQASTGRLVGSRLPPGFEPLPDTMPTGALLVNVVQGAVISPFHDVNFSLQGQLILQPRPLLLASDSLELTQQEIQEFLDETKIKSETDLLAQVKQYRDFIDVYTQRLKSFNEQARQLGAEHVAMQKNPFVYKARPLDGIWATAPYLHNGSVPNLYEMLLPAAKRSKVFHVGSLEFDPAKVGFQTGPGPATTELDTSLDGNSNSGHDQYGNDAFTEDERMQLLEYLKSL